MSSLVSSVKLKNYMKDKTILKNYYLNFLNFPSDNNILIRREQF